VADALIDVLDLRYVYDDGTTAIDNVTFHVQRGDRLGLVGPNGAGKSTLLLHLNGVLRPTGGMVRIDGLPLDDIHVSEVRRRVGLVFQEPDDMLFSTTLRDDVAFGPLQLGLAEDEVLARTAEAIAAVGLSGQEERLPHNLSMGQKRAASIAAVLSMRPDILVMDEPTSNLDPRGRRQLLELLDGLGMTLLVASHDLEFLLALCSRIIVLDGGRIVAEGPTRELLSDEPLLLQHGLERPSSLR
jgi:cobalt/nickel transport system ATP-binding protein